MVACCILIFGGHRTEVDMKQVIGEFPQPKLVVSTKESDSRTIADGLRSGRDNFLLLRFVAACMVIYGHGPAITGGKGPSDLIAWLGWGTYSGEIAVYIFFIVSGFMITGSYLRRRHLFDFLWARALRIFPAYLLCLIVTAFLLGAIYTSLPLKKYLHSPAVVGYVTDNARLNVSMAWDLPGVFETNPTRTTVNGSIWTLPAEFRMYLWVALVGTLGILSRRWMCNIAIFTLFGIGMAFPLNDIILIPAFFLHLAGMFGIGVFFYINKEYIPIGWASVGFLALLSLLLRHTVIFPFIFGLSLAQFSFTFAYCLPWHGFNRFGDYSYGIYLWGFPMQQVIAHHIPLLPPMANSVLAFLPALGLSVLSWHFVEKPMLKLKSVPARLWVSFWGAASATCRLIRKDGSRGS
jgi:peptidoglycan/LPS O-acetylase OafA/YrhL